MDIRQHATSNHMHRFTCHYVISREKSSRIRLGAPRPRRPLAFVQPCPMGVTPLMAWLPDGEKILISLFVLTESTNVTDTQTNTA